MKLRTATKLAFGAAGAGIILSIIQRAGFSIELTGSGIPWYNLILVFLSGFNWIYLGLFFLLAGILARPGAGRPKSAPLIIGAIIQAVFSIYALLPYVLISSFGDIVGNQRYLSYLGVIWALTVLAFAVFYSLKPASWAVRVIALLAGLELMLNLVLLVYLYPLNWLVFLNLVVITLIAQWFWTMFLQGAIMGD